jgi:hypothetical protein
MAQEQENVDTVSLSGKFLVAGELLRQHIDATITYEIANMCEVIARNGRAMIPMQIETARDPEWKFSNEPTEPEESICVFVHLARVDKDPIEFFRFDGR